MSVPRRDIEFFSLLNWNRTSSAKFNEQKQKNTYLHHLDLNDLVYRKPDLHALDRDATQTSNLAWVDQLFIKKGNLDPSTFDSFYNTYAPYLKLTSARVMAEMEITVWETYTTWNTEYPNKTANLWLTPLSKDTSEALWESGELATGKTSNYKNKVLFKIREGLRNTTTTRNAFFNDMPSEVLEDFSFDGGKRPQFATIRAYAEKEWGATKNYRELHVLYVRMQFRWSLNMDELSLQLLNKQNPEWAISFFDGFCVGENLEDPRCNNFCAREESIINSRCLDAAEEYCEGLLNEQGLEFASAKPVCQCHLPSSFYEQLRAELRLAQINVTDSAPHCIFAPCGSNRKWRFYPHTQCPDIITCINEVDISFEDSQVSIGGDLNVNTINVCISNHITDPSPPGDSTQEPEGELPDPGDMEQPMDLNNPEPLRPAEKFRIWARDNGWTLVLVAVAFTLILGLVLWVILRRRKN